MRRIAIPVAVVFLLVTFAWAQSNRGNVRGKVTDVAGSPIPGVAVTLVGVERRTAITDASGEYVFASLVPGDYRLHFELAGFSTVVKPITVRAGRPHRLDVRLSVDAAAETVSVVASPPPPPAASAAVGFIGGVAGGVADGVAGGVAGHAEQPEFRVRREPFNTEAYDPLDENPFRRVGTDPLSTFSVDVDTASYANVRRFLNSGAMPPPGAVRIEELVNYFRFDYLPPSADAPFSITTELAPCPWNAKHHLALVGLRGRDLPERDQTARNLVFLIDVSGSMMPPDKLPLVRTAMRLLVDTLTSRDRVAIVVYAGSSGVVLPSTRGDQKSLIQHALAQLEAGGSTNGGEGIELAYSIAREHFIRGGVNRVILATDGDFNVGVTSYDALVRLIEEQRASGIFLSMLGVGTDNLKDSTMEKLADKGNGNYAYLDSLHEARKVLVAEAGGTLVTIAKDVKIQVEFNPAAVAGYRLVGYENRMLEHQDFNDDAKDAGDIGAGHTVTALYEIVPIGIDVPASAVDPLKYQRPRQTAAGAASAELVTVKLRYKAPEGDASRLLQAVLANRVEVATPNLGFASAVAEVGMLLRSSKHAGQGSYESAISRARTFRGADSEGYRAEFIKLAELASSLARVDTSARRQ